MAAQIDLSVDRDSEVPLGTQLGWTLRTLIRTARLAPGTRLPGVRFTELLPRLASVADRIRLIRSMHQLSPSSAHTDGSHRIMTGQSGR